LVEARTIGVGRPQRHLAMLRRAALLRRLRAEIVIIEEEPFSLSASTWSRAARRVLIPYGVQVAENRPRSLPWPVDRECRRVLASASFVMARSPAALGRAREWGYSGEGGLVVHAVSEIPADVSTHPVNVVGFIGRLVPEKGIADLVWSLLEHPELNLRVAGDGPLREAFVPLGGRATLLGTLEGERVGQFYESVSVLAVPSRTTPAWSEQFGRVIVEALAHGTPVIAYASGEIPWVAELSGAVTVAEGDTAELGRRLAELAGQPDRARELGSSGRDAVRRSFSVPSAARAIASELNSALARRR
jgi:glycosyltransferase involved in cell wall biosynthesis